MLYEPTIINYTPPLICQAPITSKMHEQEFTHSYRDNIWHSGQLRGPCFIAQLLFASLKTKSLKNHSWWWRKFNISHQFCLQ